MSLGNSRFKARNNIIKVYAFIARRRELNESKIRRENRSSKRSTKARNIINNREYGLDKMRRMNDDDFQRMYRLSRRSFNLLLNLIAPKLSVNELQATRSSGSSISLITRLAVTLRWLAGGSYLDISLLYGVSTSNFFNIKHGVLWSTIDAINEAIQIGLSIEPENLQRTAEGFARLSKGYLTGCIMAIDGWVCKTRAPSTQEVESVMNYRNRKGCWGIVILAGCDSRCKFTMFNAMSSGSTNDITAWEICPMKAILESGLIPPTYYFIGDEAFSCTNKFLVPWSGQGIGDFKDAFNYFLSSMRQSIERAFGMLTKRWGIFWRPLICQMNKWSLICLTAAKLHNFCIDHNEISPEFIGVHNDNFQDGDFWEIVENNFEEDAILRNRPSGNRRRELTLMFARLGVTRPSPINSRA